MAIRYWLWDWLEKHRIDSVESASKAIKRKAERNDLCRRAGLWEPQLSAPVSGRAIVAGAGTDLSSGLQCPNPACQKYAIDQLFRKVWHYFDRVIVVDDLTHDIAHHWNPESKLEERLLRRIDVMLHVQRLGAEGLVEFRSKGLDDGDSRLEQMAKLTHVSKASRVPLDRLREEAEVKITTRGDSAEVSVCHLDLVNCTTLSLDLCRFNRRTVRTIRDCAVKEVWSQELDYLAADVFTARRLRTGLGSVRPLHQEIIGRAGELSCESVAFNLQFPVLEEVPVAALLKIRQDEADHFCRLQSRLREAITQKLPSREGESASKIAEEIRQDLIEPELRKLRTRLNASKKVLAKKSATGLTLGTLVTTCGLIAGADPVASLGYGIAAVATATFSAASKHLEEDRDVTLEDMYFLWKAIDHAPSEYRKGEKGNDHDP